MMLSFWTDAVVALLLIATIGYSVVLNRRLTAVRADRDKFDELVRNLNTASQRAETAVANLRGSADEVGRRLEKKIDEARALSDDLVYMIERGGTMADKLANLIRSGRDGLKPEPIPEPRPRVEPRPEIRTEPREHRIEPLQRPVPRVVEPQRTVRPRSESYPAQPQFATAAAEPERPRAAQPQPDRTNAPSRAERELLRALSRRR